MIAQVILKYLARVLTSQIAVENDSLCVFDIQAGILSRLCCQSSCHRCTIGISKILRLHRTITEAGYVHPSFSTWM